MSEDTHASVWRKGLKKWLNTAPETRDELLKLIQDSQQFLTHDTVDMLEGVLNLHATKVREVMTPRTALISLREQDDILDILHVLIASAHSRFPIFSDDNPDAVAGILLAKDLLPYLTQHTEQKVELAKLMRQPLFVPESARSDQVLRLLKKNQTHIAIVVDEYGTTAGIVTLEDILEEIVGEIEDEHDEANQYESYIIADPEQSDAWLVEALTPIEYLNEVLGSQFSNDEVETVGGLLLQEIGLVTDLVGQVIELSGWQFTILVADTRSIQKVRVEKQ